MRTETFANIIALLKEKGRATPKEIILHAGISAQAVFRHLSKGVREGVLEKMGTAPSVYYRLAEHSPQAASNIDSGSAAVINERFVKVLPNGTVGRGVPAFLRWCEGRGNDPEKTAREYVQSVSKFDAYKRDGLIDGMRKLQKTFPHVWLDRMHYLDFYSIERFGKTKLGELLLYAKQGQHRGLAREIADEVRPRVLAAVERWQCDAIAYVPPTVDRKVQFMVELERALALPLRRVPVVKLRMPVMVPQKTLTKLDERVQNAASSIVVKAVPPCKRLLIIDDAVGSGATINEVARQAKAFGICTGEVIGLALTGSFSDDSFEVVSEA